MVRYYDKTALLSTAVAVTYQHALSPIRGALSARRLDGSGGIVNRDARTDPMSLRTPRGVMNFT